MENKKYGIPYVNTIAKNYQRDGIFRMFTERRSYQADEMGLGKTLQTLTAIELHDTAEMSGINIIVCPKFALGVWQDEIMKWFGKGCYIYTGTPVQRRKLWNQFCKEKQVEYIVTNFAMLPELGSLCGIKHKNCPPPTWYEQATIQNFSIKSLVVDEAHFSGIFSYKTKFYKAAHQIYKHAKLKYVLTGTPIRQGCIDLFGPLSCLDPDKFKAYWNFVRDYCVTIQTPFGKTIERNPANLLGFRAMLNQYMIRRKKEEVLTELLGKQRQLLTIPMTKQQARMYKELEEEMMTLIPETGSIVISPSAMSCILRQRQVLASPQILGATDVGNGVDTIVEHSHLRLDDDVPVVVFTSFRSMIPIMEKAFKKEYPGIPVHIIQGGLTAEEFTAEWMNFQKGEGKAVLLVVIKSGASFQATRADTAYFIAPEWDVTLNVQAEDRLYRIGQKNFVNIFYINYNTMVDKRVQELLNTKTESAQFISGTEQEYLETLRTRSLKNN